MKYIILPLGQLSQTFRSRFEAPGVTVGLDRPNWISRRGWVDGWIDDINVRHIFVQGLAHILPYIS